MFSVQIGVWMRRMSNRWFFCSYTPRWWTGACIWKPPSPPICTQTHYNTQACIHTHMHAHTHRSIMHCWGNGGGGGGKHYLQTRVQSRYTKSWQLIQGCSPGTHALTSVLILVSAPLILLLLYACNTCHTSFAVCFFNVVGTDSRLTGWVSWSLCAFSR